MSLEFLESAWTLFSGKSLLMEREVEIYNININILGRMPPQKLSNDSSIY